MNENKLQEALSIMSAEYRTINTTIDPKTKLEHCNYYWGLLKMFNTLTDRKYNLQIGKGGIHYVKNDIATETTTKVTEKGGDML